MGEGWELLPTLLKNRHLFYVTLELNFNRHILPIPEGLQQAWFPPSAAHPPLLRGKVSKFKPAPPLATETGYSCQRNSSDQRGSENVVILTMIVIIWICNKFDILIFKAQFGMEKSHVLANFLIRQAHDENKAQNSHGRHLQEEA